jgi:hypothetical protein
VYTQAVTIGFNAAALLAGGVCQMAMGFAGLFLAGAFLVGINVRPPVVFAVLVVEGLIGWFVFLLFVFVNPAMDAAATPGVPSPWETRQNFNTFVAMGILASAGYCAALLGSQFAFTASLWSLSKGEDNQNEAYFRSRGVAYSFLVFITGLWLLIAGGVSSLLLPGPVNVVQPVIFVVWPGIFVATGCLAMATGGFGIVSGFFHAGHGATHILAVLHVVNCLWQIAVMALYQPPALGYVNPSTSVTILILAQLVPVYFHYMRLQPFPHPAKRNEPIELGAGVEL